MLSYMIPVEDKPLPVLNKNHLQLNLDLQKQEPGGRRNGDLNGLPSHHNGVPVDKVNGVMAPTTVQNFINIEQICSNGSGASRKIIKTHTKMNPGPAMSTESSASSLSSKTSDVTSGASQGGGATPTSIDKLKPKLVQNGGTKTTSLKRVSFGSSKGSMVETLIYESPLQEEPEVVTPTTENSNPFPMDGDTSGSDSKNPSTKVRVTFFESERPLIVHSPEPSDVILDILNASNIMTSTSPTSNQQSQYLRQTSTDSGWDNPFRPDGDLSREADEIVELIREGKPIGSLPGNGVMKAADEVDEAVAASVRGNQLSTSPQKGSNGTTKSAEKPGVVDVQRSVVSPVNGSEAEAVVIKKKPKCKCCVIQ